MTKAKARRLIALVDTLLDNSDVGLSITEWGRRVGLRRTPYLLSLISEIGEAGILCVVNREYKNGKQAFYYFIVPSDRTRALAYCNAVALQAGLGDPS